MLQEAIRLSTVRISLFMSISVYFWLGLLGPQLLSFFSYYVHTLSPDLFIHNTLNSSVSIATPPQKKSMKTLFTHSNGKSQLLIGTASDLNVSALANSNVKLLINCGVEMDAMIQLLTPDDQVRRCKELHESKIPCELSMVLNPQTGLRWMVSHMFRELWNDENEQLAGSYWPIIRAIEHAFEKTGSVMLYCDKTHSRSASLAMAYLMLHQDLGFNQVYIQVLSQLNDLDLNPGFGVQLQQLRLMIDFYNVHKQAKQKGYVQQKTPDGLGCREIQM